MLEYLEDRFEATYLIPEWAERLMVAHAEAKTALSHIEKAVTESKSKLVQDEERSLVQLFHEPSVAHIMGHMLFKLEDGTYKAAAQKMVEDRAVGAVGYVGAMVLISLHSFLEEFVLELLRMTRLCEIKLWLDLLAKGDKELHVSKNVEVSTLIQGGVEKTLEEKLQKVCDEIQRLGLMSKIQKLLGILKVDAGKSEFDGYSFDLVKLKKIDDCRHDFAHRRRKEYSRADAEADLLYLVMTGFHLLTLTMRRFGITGALRPIGA
jgi:hypothetical protein